MCLYVSGFIAINLVLASCYFVDRIFPSPDSDPRNDTKQHEKNPTWPVVGRFSATDFDLMIEPCFRHAPITFHLIDRQPHHLSRLFNRQAAKESELDYATLLRCNLGQLSQSFIE